MLQATNNFWKNDFHGSSDTWAKKADFDILLAEAQEALWKAKAKHTKYGKLRRRYVHFKVGDEVLIVLSSAIKHIVTKLTSKLEGPYEII